MLGRATFLSTEDTLLTIQQEYFINNENFFVCIKFAGKFELYILWYMYRREKKIWLYSFFFPSYKITV
jgi:hypothetical protein